VSRFHYVQIPKAMGEEDIFPTFDSFGPLKDVAVIRDKHTGLHRGCAFVTYWSGADADRAQEALHDKYTFPGARRPAQVKPAEPSVPENKLFVGMLSRKAGEAEVRELFAPFGEIREIYMIRNADGSSKCAAFLRYVKREAAVQAIASLNNNILMEGSARPLIVKFADNKHQRQQRQIRNVRRQEIMVAMGPGYPAYPPVAMPGHHPGAVPQYPQPPPQYGAGATPQYGAGATPQYGAGATPQYNAGATPQYNAGATPQYNAGATPQYNAGATPQYNAGAYGPGPGAQHPPPPPHPYMYPAPQYGAPPPYGFQARLELRPPNPNPRPREGPAGANLFVYHLPHDLTDADLATAFNPFGNVISAKVYVDKYTGESKGFGKLTHTHMSTRVNVSILHFLLLIDCLLLLGFVSYDSVISAEAAIEQMNGFQIGNKRLKVQHKRVHGNPGSPDMGPQDPPESPPPP
jgi:CUG-BP- and ETR3-like factor